MEKRFLVFLCILFMMGIYSCSRKSHPGKTTTTPATEVTNNADSAAAAVKVIAKRKEKVAIPKMIVVNDSTARKSVDGRLYYDMLGHRYWRNNKDGKYYLFNKSMYNNPDFKKPG